MTEVRTPPVHTPMNQFPVQGCELLVNGIPLSRIAARMGRTPFYVYDRSLLTSRVKQLRSALPTAIKLHYAMKANPMPALVCHMAGLVDGIDVASAGELMVALDAGANPQEVSFAGPGKTDAELRQAVAAGILINVESFREVPILAAAGSELGLPARVAVRVNPDFEIKSSGMKMGGGPKQFTDITDSGRVGQDDPASSPPGGKACCQREKGFRRGAMGLLYQGWHCLRCTERQAGGWRPGDQFRRWQPLCRRTGGRQAGGQGNPATGKW